MIDLTVDELIYINNAVATHLDYVRQEFQMYQIAATACPAVTFTEYENIRQVLVDLETGSDIILKLIPHLDFESGKEEVEKLTRNNKIKAIEAREDLEAEVLAFNHAESN